MITWLAAGAVALVSVVISNLSGTTRYMDGACQRVSKYLTQEIVGQELAIDYLVAAVCDHLERKESRGPLVLSAHGPPGVGKTLTHQLLARALYQAEPANAVNCPGPQCRGYKVIYGMDFLDSEASQQLAAVRGAVLDHLRHAPESLLVIEEYDKLGCPSRAMFRQLLDHPEIANISMNRAIVMFESNLGMNQLKELVDEAGAREKVTIKDTSRVLKNLVYDTWRQVPDGDEDCESEADTIKLTSMISYYLPYLPLGKMQVKILVERQLLERRERLMESHGVTLDWDSRLVPFFLEQLEFVEGFLLDGARAVRPVVVPMVKSALMQRAVVELLASALERRRKAGAWPSNQAAQDERSLPGIWLVTPRSLSGVLEAKVKAS